MSQTFFLSVLLWPHWPFCITLWMPFSNSVPYMYIVHEKTHKIVFSSHNLVIEQCSNQTAILRFCHLKNILYGFGFPPLQICSGFFPEIHNLIYNKVANCTARVVSSLLFKLDKNVACSVIQLTS
jgi:hypothetical protein